MPKVPNAFRVWHIPQVPMPAFEVECATLDEAVRIRDVLSEYDLFEFRNKVKPDYSNASGIQRWTDGEWEDLDDDEIVELTLRCKHCHHRIERKEFRWVHDTGLMACGEGLDISMQQWMEMPRGSRPRAEPPDDWSA